MRRVNGPSEAAIKLCEAERAALNAAARGEDASGKYIKSELWMRTMRRVRPAKMWLTIFRGGENLMESLAAIKPRTGAIVIFLSPRVCFFLSPLSLGARRARLNNQYSRF